MGIMLGLELSVVLDNLKKEQSREVTFLRSWAGVCWWMETDPMLSHVDAN